MSLPIEFEATFPDINKDEMRARLKAAGAKLVKAEFLQRRVVFNFPQGHAIAGGWLRVRDESDRITMSLKVVSGAKIEDQKEICLTVDDFEKAASLLENIGCERKAFQESKREKWDLDGVEITLDEWPFLEPFMEIEADSADKVKAATEKLGLDYSQALFCSVDTLYSKKYGWGIDLINNWLPSITFNEPNPFLADAKK